MSPLGPPSLTIIGRGIAPARLLCVLGLAFLAGAPPLGAQETTTEPERVLRENARVTLHTVRLRIDSVRDADPADCAALGLEGLAVSLRGNRLPAELLVSLERRQVPTLHALLIDTSSSMVGKLGFVRDAAKRYVEHLRPGLDRALVATFDENTLLVQPASSDRDALLAAIDSVRMGLATSLHDGLYHVIDELNAYAERPVVLLLTDGADNSSLYERHDINELVQSSGDLVVFVVGYGLPVIHAGKAGLSSAKRFLQNLAGRTGGEFFDVPTASRLERAYRGIRRMLAAEATLTLTDPDPAAAAAARVRVRSTHPSCKVTVFRESPGTPPVNEIDRSPPDGAFDRRLPLPPGDPLRDRYGLPGATTIPERCAAASGKLPDAACFVEALPDRLSGCALDIALDGGMLYSTLDASRWEINDWMELRVRPFEVAVPGLADLPRDPVEVLDALAARVIALAGTAVATDHRKQPPHRHARPFVDVPELVNGRTFLDTRGVLASALFHYPGYGEWVRARLAREAERELTELSETFRQVAPGLSGAELRQAVEVSAAGRRIRRRAESPTPQDLRRDLGAWLGDVSAHELFTRWEVRHLNRKLAGEERAEPFLQAWAALYRVFFVPSYARVLALLHPVHDPTQDRIGFWRVVLPRVSWLMPRVQNAEHHPEFSDLPLDLVPDAPFGFHALDGLLTGDAETRRRLHDADYRVTSVGYELLGKPWKRDPPRAFRHVRVTVALATDRDGDCLELVAEMHRDPDTGAVSIAGCSWEGEHAEEFPSCASTLPGGEAPGPAGGPAQRSTIRTPLSVGVVPLMPIPAH